MTYTVNTSVTMIVQNKVSADEMEQLLDGSEYDDVSDYAASLESDMEGLLATRTFGGADDIPILDVTTTVESE